MANDFEMGFYTPPSLWVRLGETAALTLLVPVLGLIFRPSDPFFVDSGVTWLIIAPLLVGIRYGFVLGLVSGIGTVVLSASVHEFGSNWAGIDPHGCTWSYAVGIVLAGMLAGEFTDVWRRRLERTQVVNDYRKSRLDQFVRHYHLLRVSHDQLAERLAATPHNLRDALMNLGQRFGEVQSGDDILALKAPDILRFLSEEGRIQQCAIFRVSDDAVISGALESVGPTPHAFEPAADPMVNACLAGRQMISVNSQQINDADRSHLAIYAVVPLIDVNDCIWAVVTVHDMPFILFDQSNLHLLAVLGGNIGDQLATAYKRVGQKDSSDYRYFESEVDRWASYGRRYDLESLLVVYRLPNGMQGVSAEAVYALILEQERALDSLSPLQPSADADCHFIFLLMPLTPAVGFTAYRTRMSHLFREYFGMSLDKSGIELYQKPIDGSRQARAVFDQIDAR